MQQLKQQHLLVEISPMAPRSLSQLHPSFCWLRAPFAPHQTLDDPQKETANTR